MIDGLEPLRHLAVAGVDEPGRWLVKYRLFYPDDTDLLSKAIQEARDLTARRAGSDCKHERDRTST